ncbi:MAG: radical SAM protein [Oscillospiraceae bacterium]|nr:radical SAM protein [Oscillospiraceae bacterium]
MKVFFVNPPFKSEYGKFSRENRSPAVTRSGTLYYPLWLIYAAAVCEKDGFEVEFLDAPAKPMNNAEAYEYIKSHADGTKLFVINTSTPSIVNDTDYGDKIKELYPDAFVMLVGTHPSALPEETLKNSKNVDAVARREYDYIVREAAEAIRDGRDPFLTNGLTYRKNNEIKSNPDMPFITDMDEIPFLAEFVKKHLNYKDYFFAAAAYPEMQIFTGRGCMARCNFCVYPQTMHGHNYRMRSAENVVAELEYIAENFSDVKEIVFEDDTFTIIKDRVIQICNLMIEKGLNKRFRWLCNARVNLDYETMVIMKKAGCHLIIPGIESGSDEILKNIHKGTTLKQVHQYISDAKKAKLAVHACYMVGNKGETRETMQQTLELALKLNTDTAQFYPLLPFPGTEAYMWAKSNGYINGTYSDYVKEDGTINSLLELPNLSGKEMVEFCDNARKKYYMRPRYILHRLWVGLHDWQDLKRSLKAFNKIKKFLFK